MRNRIANIYVLAFSLSRNLRSFSDSFERASLYNSSSIYLFLIFVIFASQIDGRRTVRRPRKINSIDFVWQRLDTLVYRADGCQLYSIVRARSDSLHGVMSDTYCVQGVQFLPQENDRFFDKYKKFFNKIIILKAHNCTDIKYINWKLNI